MIPVQSVIDQNTPQLIYLYFFLNSSWNIKSTTKKYIISAISDQCNTSPSFHLQFSVRGQAAVGPDSAALEKYSPESIGISALRLRVHLQVKG